MPKQAEIEVPLLRCLEEMGGRGRPAEIYERLRAYFPGLTDAEVAEMLSSGASRWTNRIQWARQNLVSKGELSNAERGVWEITDKGRKRLQASREEAAASRKAAGRASLREGQHMPPLERLNLEEITDDYAQSFRFRLRQRLLDLTPEQFERFAGRLLAAYGFSEVVVTGKSGDGGIDGYGKLRVGLALMEVAFQCKRWQGPVGRPEIDKFRGGIQGKFEQGIFLTTSEFSEPARAASIQKGAVTVVLVDGDGIAQLMIERGLGVRRRSVEIYEDQLDGLFEEK